MLLSYGPYLSTSLPDSALAFEGRFDTPWKIRFSSLSCFTSVGEAHPQCPRMRSSHDHCQSVAFITRPSGVKGQAP